MLRILLGVVLVAAAFMPTPMPTPVQGSAGSQQALWTVLLLFSGYRIGFWGLKAMRKEFRG